MFLATFNSNTLTIDDSGIVRINGIYLYLSESRRKCLEILVRHAGKVCTFQMMLNHLYAGRHQAEQKIVDILVYSIRKQFHEMIPDSDKIISTVWGRGYCLVDIAAEATQTRERPSFLPFEERWVPSRKAQVVWALNLRKITRSEVFEHYPDLSEIELDEWMDAIEKFGEPGLRATRTQEYARI